MIRITAMANSVELIRVRTLLIYRVGSRFNYARASFIVQNPLTNGFIDVDSTAETCDVLTATNI